MKLITLIIAGLMAGLFSSASVAGADKNAGKVLVEKVCASCHGADGNSQVPIYPKLAGQYASYLSQSLKAYRSGQRQNPFMSGFAASLSDDDITNIAAYYASQSGDLKTLK